MAASEFSPSLLDRLDPVTKSPIALEQYYFDEFVKNGGLPTPFPVPPPVSLLNVLLWLMRICAVKQNVARELKEAKINLHDYAKRINIDPKYSNIALPGDVSKKGEIITEYGFLVNLYDASDKMDMMMFCEVDEVIARLVFEDVVYPHYTDVVTELFQNNVPTSYVKFKVMCNDVCEYWATPRSSIFTKKFNSTDKRVFVYGTRGMAICALIYGLIVAKPLNASADYTPDIIKACTMETKKHILAVDFTFRIQTWRYRIEPTICFMQGIVLSNIGTFNGDTVLELICQNAKTIINGLPAPLINAGRNYMFNGYKQNAYNAPVVSTQFYLTHVVLYMEQMYGDGFSSYGGAVSNGSDMNPFLKVDIPRDMTAFEPHDKSACQWMWYQDHHSPPPPPLVITLGDPSAIDVSNRFAEIETRVQEVVDGLRMVDAKLTIPDAMDILKAQVSSTFTTPAQRDHLNKLIVAHDDTIRKSVYKDISKQFKDLSNKIKAEPNTYSNVLSTIDLVLFVSGDRTATGFTQQIENIDSVLDLIRVIDILFQLFVKFHARYISKPSAGALDEITEAMGNVEFEKRFKYVLSPSLAIPPPPPPPATTGGAAATATATTGTPVQTATVDEKVYKDFENALARFGMYERVVYYAGLIRASQVPATASLGVIQIVGEERKGAFANIVDTLILALIGSYKREKQHVSDIGKLSGELDILRAKDKNRLQSKMDDILDTILTKLEASDKKTSKMVRSLIDNDLLAGIRDADPLFNRTHVSGKFHTDYPLIKSRAVLDMINRIGAINIDNLIKSQEMFVCSECGTTALRDLVMHNTTNESVYALLCPLHRSALRDIPFKTMVLHGSYANHAFVEYAPRTTL